MQAGEEYAVRFADPVCDNCALLQLQVERCADQLLRDLEQLLGQRDEFAGR